MGLVAASAAQAHWQDDIGVFMAHHHRKHDAGALTHVNAPKHVVFDD
ncbi:hypothetical protein [Dyella silvae]|nr:hypothetical protein [Dyella silvae]